MVDSRSSGTTFLSDLAKELDRIQVLEDYELNDFSYDPTAASSPYLRTRDQEDEHVLLAQAGEHGERLRSVAIS